ncbi:DUF2271 domain-containing protein [Flavobacterium agricola]|uniref:DUF2271 domain-containing protein n=1 Tax=Flavobacterium agricola TaxID=2870839 RepID=A0ABY6M3N9_9FLAO|nr:DUF2271 domain-containing protein [Flavobacterium agricola]UYW02532.1 DUF2271 domain-containing protein [Flavobacterium agricola]
MKITNKYILLVLFVFASSITAFAQTAKYKCMLQMTNYQGLEAYVVVSLIDPKGNYEETLYMMGPDKQWYNGFKEWDKFNKKKKEKLNGITGASIAAGNRSLTTFNLDESKLDKGYKLRFESAVEDKDYFVTDVEIPLTTAGITQKTDGNGYIRYVKLTKAN